MMLLSGEKKHATLATANEPHAHGRARPCAEVCTEPCARSCFYQETCELPAAKLRCHQGARQCGCTHAPTDTAKRRRRSGGGAVTEINLKWKLGREVPFFFCWNEPRFPVVHSSGLLSPSLATSLCSRRSNLSSSTGTPSSSSCHPAAALYVYFTLNMSHMLREYCSLPTG